jgi:hypothetical protein
MIVTKSQSVVDEVRPRIPRILFEELLVTGKGKIVELPVEDVVDLEKLFVDGVPGLFGMLLLLGILRLLAGRLEGLDGIGVTKELGWKEKEPKTADRRKRNSGRIPAMGSLQSWVLCPGHQRRF